MPRLPELPPGFVLRRDGGGLLVAAERLVAALDAVGFEPSGDRGELPASDLSGRARLDEIVVGDERLVVRRYRHGGLLRWLTGARFADPARPVRELCLAAALRARGVPTPAVVAARACPARPGWTLALVSVRVEDALDLGTALEAIRAGELAAGARHRLFAQTGALLARLHAEGLAHADLQPRNLLVERASLASPAPSLWVLDLDRSALEPHLDDVRRRANLARLVRAARRRDARGRPFLARTDLARFLRAYAPATWRDEWRGVLAALERRSWHHRLGWWLERRFGANPATRDGAARVRG